MNDQHLMAPLAAFHGLKPPAPAWFERAMSDEPERSFVDVEGARVETLAWGKRGKPGLILLHGGAAHADWWSFIAPFFAGAHRVVAPTFTGMGRSDWRERYVFDQFVREARDAGRAAGAFDAGPPVVVGHSFGGRVAMGAARDFGDEISSAVMVDPPFFAPQNVRPPAPPRPTRARRVQHSLSAIVARFRLAPPQPCENLFILDAIARRSAREVADAEGKPGWALSFDPHFWEKFTRIDPAPIVAGGALPSGAHPRRRVAALSRRRRRAPDEPAAARLALYRDPRGRPPRDDRPADRLCRRPESADRGMAGKAGLSASFCRRP